MLSDNLLEKIEFTEEWKELFLKYQGLFGDEIEPYCRAYMSSEITMAEAMEKIRRFESEDVSPYTVDLMFLLNLTGYLWEKYQESGISEEIFINSMKDITYKTKECIDVKGVWGTFVLSWFNGFFKNGRYGLGRLQYDKIPLVIDSVTVKGHTFKKGDMVLWCHIPSSGPLTHELCIESYKMAYRIHKDIVKDGVLPIFCGSWFLYPEYIKVFGEESNITRFSKDFDIFHVNREETFRDSWRVFGMDCDNTDALPSKTSMQRKFIEYIKGGGSFGHANGLLLFDGDKVITGRED